MPSKTEKLFAKWNARLRKEGMPEELHVSKKQSLNNVGYGSKNRARFDDENESAGWTPDSAPMAPLDQSDTFQYWTTMEHAAQALPESNRNKRLLVRYSQSGYLLRECRDLGVTIKRGRLIVAKFETELRRKGLL